MAARRHAYRFAGLLVAAGILGLLYLGLRAFLPAAPSGAPLRLIEIPRHSNSREIADRLAERGIINSAAAFRIMTRILGENQHLQAGDYRLTPSMSLGQIVEAMAQGNSVNRWLTVPEGYTVVQIARQLRRLHMTDNAHFLEIARMGGETFHHLSFHPPANLEGYLFPDTYKLRAHATPRQILAVMLHNFDQKVARPLHRDLEASTARGFPLRKVVILASLVEREARQPQDRPLIAGVLVNRLRHGMKLQVDATVQFALGINKPRLRLRDLQVQSPYNTYLVSGLPPGPICNPGLAALKAALHPAKTDYFYYVAKPDGGHLFARTLPEHEANRVRVAQMARKA